MASDGRGTTRVRGEGRAGGEYKGIQINTQNAQTATDFGVVCVSFLWYILMKET